VAITALTEVDVTGVDGAAEWRDTFDITFPVLADSDWEVWDLYNLSGGRPYYVVLGRDMVVVPGGGQGPPGEESAKEAILELLAE
jgi:hypothetical protein